MDGDYTDISDWAFLGLAVLLLLSIAYGAATPNRAENSTTEKMDELYRRMLLAGWVRATPELLECNRASWWTCTYLGAGWRGTAWRTAWASLGCLRAPVDEYRGADAE